MSTDMGTGKGKGKGKSMSNGNGIRTGTGKGKGKGTDKGKGKGKDKGKGKGKGKGKRKGEGRDKDEAEGNVTSPRLVVTLTKRTITRRLKSRPTLSPKIYVAVKSSRCYATPTFQTGTSSLQSQARWYLAKKQKSASIFAPITRKEPNTQATARESGRIILKPIRNTTHLRENAQQNRTIQENEMSSSLGQT